MRKAIFTMMLLAVGLTAVAQETHYHRALRGQDTDYGIKVSSDTYMGGVTPGMYWTRTRDINDVAIVDATPEDSIARHAEFMRHYNNAFEAYVAGDAPRTLLYGDSALQTRLQAADLIFYMAISFERLGLYQDARLAYRKAKAAGYAPAVIAYKDFRKRQKARKKALKQSKK